MVSDWYHSELGSLMKEVWRKILKDAGIFVPVAAAVVSSPHFVWF